jgi:hypothetical protein
MVPPQFAGDDQISALQSEIATLRSEIDALREEHRALVRRLTKALSG